MVFFIKIIGVKRSVRVVIDVILYESLGHADHGWLDARHHFSFADYYDPKKMGFGVLRVINDDVIHAGTGFGTHPHRNMEIITYVRQGGITHRDSQGNEGRTSTGNVQVMSAGKGIHHSEHNEESEDTRLYQIWIEPNKLGLTPRWKTHEFSKDYVTDKLTLLVSGNGDAPLTIHQDAFIYVGVLKKGTQLNHDIKHQAYLLVSDGNVEVDGHVLKKGDGAAITAQSSVKLTAVSDVEVLVIDVPKK